MEVLATIYCGDDYYRKHAKESSLKIAAMVQKLGADVLLCGPCFNYETYGEMAAEVAKVVEERFRSLLLRRCPLNAKRQSQDLKIK